MDEAAPQAAAGTGPVVRNPGSPDRTVNVDEVRARHPDRVIRREGFTWVASDPDGAMPSVESGRLDFLDAMLGGTGETG
jgi:hypothetical protein